MDLFTDTDFSRWLLVVFLLTSVWALGLAISQHFSIPAEDNYRRKDPVGRFFLSLFLLLPMVLLLPRSLILILLTLSMLWQWGTMYYHSYFGTPPEIMVLLNNAAEGAEVGNAMWGMLPWKYLLFLLPFFIIQVILLHYAPMPGPVYPQCLKLALFSIASYGILLGTLYTLARKSVGRTTPGSRCAKFGFLPVFVGDFLFRYTQYDKLKKEALQNESKWSLGLNSEYQEFTFGDVVVMQVETLDNAVLDYCIKGRMAVPFLHSLQKTSLLYRIGANCRYGSATADFEMLTGIPPLDNCFNYKVPDLPYHTSLAQFFSEQGYETFCFHGVRGSFYNRRNAYSAMNFDHLVFREEIIDAIRKGKYPLHDDFPPEQLADHLEKKWLRDDVVLKTVLKEIGSPSGRKRFFFVITATSHTPFPTKHVSGTVPLIPNEVTKQDRYLNSIHVVDDWLRSFYEGLPPGTLLVIYGDHTAKIQSETFRSDMDGHREFVPCFIHVVGENLAPFQRVPRRARETILSVRDVHSFLRSVTMARDVMMGRK